MALSVMNSSVTPRFGYPERLVVMRCEYIEDLAYCYYHMCARAFPGVQVSFSPELLAKFLKTMLAIRVALVRRNVYIDKLRGHNYRAYRVPAYWAMVLDGIGHATDSTHTPVTLTPAFNDWDDVLSPEECVAFINNHLKQYSNVFVLRELPRGDTGRLSLMSRALVLDEAIHLSIVTSYRPDCSPADSMAAVWAGIHLLDESLAVYYPYNFGDVNAYINNFDIDTDSKEEDRYGREPTSTETPAS